jgi:hypothetical protein
MPAGVSFIAGTTATFVASGTTISQNLPASILDDDDIFAYVFGRSALTPPAGWTLVDSQAFTAVGGTLTQTLYVYRKNTVLSTDSSTSVTWTQASSGRMGVFYHHYRVGVGPLIVVGTPGKNALNSTTVSTITSAALASGREQLLVSVGSVVAQSGGAYSPTAPAGFTLTSGASLADYRIMGSYKTDAGGDGVSAGTWTLCTSTSDSGAGSISFALMDTASPHTATVSEGLGVNDLPRREVTGETPKAEVLLPATPKSVAGASLTLRLPGGLKSTDMVFAFVYANGTGGVTPPSGWTQQWWGTGNVTSVNSRYHTFKKDTVTPSTDDLAEFTFTNGDIVMGGFMTVVEGINGTLDIPTTYSGVDWPDDDDFASQTTIPSTRNGASPYITATRDGQVALFFGYFRTFTGDGMDTGYPTPAGSLVAYTPAAATDNTGYLAGAYQKLDDTDTADIAGWTVTASAEFSYAGLAFILVDIVPPPMLDEEISEVVSIAYSLLANEDQEATVAEGIAFAPVLLKSFVLPPVTVTDNPRVSASVVKYNSRHSLTGSDTIGTAGALVVNPGAIVPETIGLDPTLGVEATYGMTLADIVRQRDALRVSIPVLLSRTIGIDAMGTVVQGLTVLEELGLTITLRPNVTYGQLANDVMRLRTTLGRFIGGGVSETVGLLGAMSPAWAFAKTVSDGVGIAPLTSPQMLLRVTAADEIGIEPEQLLRAIYAGTLADGIEVVAGYVAPNGSFTTWAINTNKGFVTQYDNFVFNSFAPMGRKYLAASSTGLYELNGDDDAGTDIIARIKSGNLQIGGAQLTSFKGAYLGVRGSGDFVLKLTTGDGKTHTYGVTVESLKTAKINIGKGVRTRYFAFELISTGQDFDLESIEFLPIVASRRV